MKLLANQLHASRLCFGGMFRKQLYICGSTSLYALYTSAMGAMKPRLDDVMSETLFR